MKKSKRKKEKNTEGEEKVQKKKQKKVKSVEDTTQEDTTTENDISACALDSAQGEDKKEKVQKKKRKQKKSKVEESTATESCESDIPVSLLESTTQEQGTEEKSQKKKQRKRKSKADTNTTTSCESEDTPASSQESAQELETKEMKTNDFTSASKSSATGKSTAKKTKKSRKQPVSAYNEGEISEITASDVGDSDDVQKTLNFTLTDESDSINNSDSKVTKKNKRASMPGKALSTLSDDNVSSNKETATAKKSKKARKSLPAKLAAMETEPVATEKPNKSEPVDKKDSVVLAEIVEPVLNVSEEPAIPASSKKKRSKKVLSAEDAPKPLVEFISKPDTPKAFVRKKAANTEPRKTKAQVEVKKKSHLSSNIALFSLILL